MADELRVEVRSIIDIVKARQQGREIAAQVGFVGVENTLIVAAISEVARNIIDHAQRGEIRLSALQQGPRRGIQVIALDEGPGIADVAKAMQYGYSTRKGLGVGLPGAKWLMDDFEIASVVGKGTTVTMTKWLECR